LGQDFGANQTPTRKRKRKKRERRESWGTEGIRV